MRFENETMLFKEETMRLEKETKRLENDTKRFRRGVIWGDSRIVQKLLGTGTGTFRYIFWMYKSSILRVYPTLSYPHKGGVWSERGGYPNGLTQPPWFRSLLLVS